MHRNNYVSLKKKNSPILPDLPTYPKKCEDEFKTPASPILSNKSTEIKKTFIPSTENEKYFIPSTETEKTFIRSTENKKTFIQSTENEKTFIPSTENEKTFIPSTKNVLTTSIEISEDCHDSLPKKKNIKLPSENTQSTKTSTKSTIIKSTNQSSTKYSKLQEILDLLPVSSDCLVSTYGIIKVYHDEKMTIMDETCDKFVLYPNINSDSLTFEIGDIIRFHRLKIKKNMTRRNPNIRNIVIFCSFQSQPVVAETLAQTFTMTKFDHERIEELNLLNIKNLLLEPLIQIKKSYIIIEASLKFLCIRPDYKTVCCWTPANFVNKYPCLPNCDIETLISEIKGIENTVEEQLIRRLFQKNLLIFLNVSSDHMAAASKLKFNDIFVIFNMLAYKHENGIHYRYFLKEGTDFGQCIRTVENESLLGQKMQELIEKFIDELSCSSSPTDEVLPIKRKFSFKDFDTIKKIHSSSVFQDEDESNDNNYMQIHYDNYGKTDPVFLVDPLDLPIKDNIMQYDVYLYLKNHSSLPDLPLIHNFYEMNHYPANTFMIEAKLFKYFGKTESGIDIFDSLDNLKTYALLVKCSNKRCGSFCSIDLFQKTTIGEMNPRYIRCPKCLSKGQLCLDIHLVLTDRHQKFEYCRFTNLASNSFFQCSTNGIFYDMPKVLIQIKTMLYCLKKISQSMNFSPHDTKKLIWVLSIHKQQLWIVDVKYLEIS